MWLKELGQISSRMTFTGSIIHLPYKPPKLPYENARPPEHISGVNHSAICPIHLRHDRHYHSVGYSIG
jgi:hypothetical protein